MSDPASKLESVAVIGAGTMGHGIAQVAAMGGLRTVIYDEDVDALERSLQRIVDNLDKGVAKGKLTEADVERTRGNLEVTDELEEAAGRADVVIEAVPERIDLKLALFSRLDGAAPGHAILATNTSSLSITEIAAATRRPEQVIGMHFFNPVHIMKLVEVVRGLETRADVVETTTELARRMAKEVVVVNEAPGFVTSRVNALIGNEAFEMLETGVASAEDIDRALKLGLNHPMGPFELVDLVGLDVRLGVLSYLHQTLGEKYRPSPLLVKYVKAGRLGKKVGRGVYTYGPDGQRVESR